MADLKEHLLPPRPSVAVASEAPSRLSIPGRPLFQGLDPARNLRLLDPLFDYPSTILGREKVIVVNFEQIKCIIIAEEVLLLNSLDNNVLQYVAELQKRLTAGNHMGGGKVWQSGTRSSFEFRALEVALEAACTSLDSQATELELEAYPLLDELTSKISTLNLERVRR